MQATTKAVVASGLALLAVICVISLQQAEESDFAREALSIEAVKGAAKHHLKKAHKHFKLPIKGQHELKSRIAKALKVAAKSLRTAKGKKAQTAAKAAVKAALASAGVADAANAGTIAWANRNLHIAKKWAEHALKRDSKALGKVAAWKHGDRKTGLKMRKKCENAVESMIAVASATKNKAEVAKEAKLRAAGKLKSYDGPIKKARKASMYAQKAVENARAALAGTLGTKTRIAAKHALVRAESAVHDANMLLKTEIGRKSAITSNRLQAVGLRLVGESMLHYKCRRTFHRANRVLKLVTAALDRARKNHYSHKEATMKQTQKITMEKAAKLKAQEYKHKVKKNRAAKERAKREKVAAKLAQQALKYGEAARNDAKAAAKAGKIAATNALASARLKAKLSGKKKRSTKMVQTALHRETIAANLADKAARMERAIVTGGKIPKEVEEFFH